MQKTKTINKGYEKHTDIYGRKRYICPLCLSYYDKGQEVSGQLNGTNIIMQICNYCYDKYFTQGGNYIK